MTALRLALVVLLLLLAGLVALPFTATGTRLLVPMVEGFAGVEIEHQGGSLMGDLRLRRIRVPTEDAVVILSGVSTRLDAGCLLRGDICLGQLSMAGVDVEVLFSDRATEDSGLWPLPFRVSADEVSIGQLRVHWGSGDISSTRISGGAEVAGERITISGLVAHGTRLRQPDDGSPTPEEPLVLPDVEMPLALVVDGATLYDAGWDIEGVSNHYDELRLSGSWEGTPLVFDELRLDNAGWGRLTLQGQVDFVHPYSFALDSRFEATGPLPWEGLQGVTGELRLGGDLAGLQFEGRLCDGPVPLTVDGSIDLVHRSWPLALAARGDCGDGARALVLNELPGLTEAPPLAIAEGWTLRLAGDFAAQDIAARAALIGAGPGEPLQLDLQGAHRAGRLQIERLQATREDGAQTLQLTGGLDYGETVDWDLSLALESVELPPQLAPLAGRLSGSLRSRGRAGEQGWSIELSRAALHGTINDLPAQISGVFRLDHEQDFTGTDLTADLNNANLHVVDVPGQLPRAEIRVGELGHWFEGARGGFEAALRWDGERSAVTLQGGSRGLQWSGVQTGQIRLDGRFDYRQGGDFSLALKAAGARIGDSALETVTLDLAGQAGAHRLDLGLSGDLDTRVSLTGSLVEGTWRGQLEPATLDAPFGHWQLQEAVAVNYLSETRQLGVAAHCWRDGELALCFDELTLGPGGLARAHFDGDLYNFAALLPENFEIRGPLSANLDARWADFRLQQLSAGLQIENTVLREKLVSGDWSELVWKHISFAYQGNPDTGRLRGSLRQEDTEALVLDVILPAAMDGELSGDLLLHGMDLHTLQNMVEEFSLLRGQLAGALRFSGDLRKPEIAGRLQLRDGQLSLARSNTSLEAIELEAVFDGHRADLRGRLVAGGGGSELHGELDWQQRLRLSLAMTGEEKQLAFPPTTRLSVAENLLLELNSERIRLSGSVNVLGGELVLEEMPASAVEVSDDVVLFDAGGTPLRQSAPTPVELDVKVNIADRFLARTSGIEARLGGQLQVIKGSRKLLRLLGGIDISEGRFELLGPRFDVKRGRLSFIGVPDNPELDIVLEREISEDQVTVGIRVGGNLDLPELDFYSRPALPEAEVMAYVLGGRGIDRTGDTSSLGLALAMTSGLMQSGGILEGVSLAVEGKDTKARAAIGGYISDRIYVSYGVGLYTPISTLTVRMDIMRNLWAEMVSGLENSGDIYYAWSM